MPATDTPVNEQPRTAAGHRPASVSYDPKFKIDWNEAERWYVRQTPRPSVEDVARKFGVNRATAYCRANRYHWGRKRREFWRLAREHAAAVDREAVAAGLAARYRVLRRLVDVALEEAATRYSVEAARHALALINVEKEIVNGLPPDASRERVLREHVERALAAAGMGAVEDVV